MRVTLSEIEFVLTEPVDRWKANPPVAYQVARWLHRYSPRGKGWFPRFIGRNWCPRAHFAVRTGRGALVAVSPQELDYYVGQTSATDNDDRRVVDACTSLLRPGETIFEVGAHGGYMAVEIAAAHRGQVRVHAFEPQLGLALVAAVSGALNVFPDWHVYRTMVGAQSGVGTLFLATSGYHASAVGREGNELPMRCPLVTLDDLVAAGLPPPSVIKVDVEGGERDVFRGARELLKNHQPSLVFESDVNMSRFGYGRVELLGDLVACAPYRFYLISPAGLVPWRPESDDPTLANVVAVAPRYHDRVGIGRGPSGEGL